MSRTISIKMFDREDKTWVTDFRSTFLKGYESDGTNELRIGSSDDSFAIIQSTGLRDMLGKEIYEGDIVTWSDGEYKHYSNPRIAVVEFNPELSFYAVNVVEHSGICKYTDRVNHGHKFGYSNFAYRDTENHLQVIGNIYENRELLKYEI